MTVKHLRSLLPLLSILFFENTAGLAQCPTLSQNSTLDPCGGQQPCNLCPGDVITLTTSGTNIKAGACVKWYLGTTPNFNPYTGAGTYLGCSEVDLQPPSSCATCPQNVAIFVDACGTEAANEFMLITSGSGFYVDDMTVDFDDANNIGPSDADINDGCPWGYPSAATVAAIQAACPGATVVGAGPGDIVPPGVLVLICTSAGFNYPYNWGGLCPLISTIYIMQNSCNRTNQAFQNNPGGGLQSTTVSLECGCSDNSTYDTGSLVGGNGAFYTDFLFPFYGNAGCGIPGGLPPQPPAPPPVLEVPPLDTTLWAGLCNSGPYWAVGIYTPLPPGCPQAFTNYMKFNVVCPTPALLAGTTCNSVNNFNLDDLVDPNFPTGVWTGANVVGGNTFNAVGLAPGVYTVKFDPDGDCALVAMTTITVTAAPKATLVSGTSTVCAGQPVNLTINLVGTPPFDITYLANGVAQPPITANATPYILTVKPTVNTIYSLSAMNDLNCVGTFTGVYTVTTLPVPTAKISGNAVICPGDSAQAFIDFTGTGPWTFSYSADGVIVDTLTTSIDPDTIWVFPTDTTIYKIVKVWNATCPGTVSGADTVNVKPLPTATMSGSVNLCATSQPVKLPIDFTGKGPWSFVYSINGISQPAITTSSNPYQLTVTPSGPTTEYTLVSISALGCGGTVGGGATVNIVPAVSAVMTGSVGDCAGTPSQIIVTFTGGAAPWHFTFTENGFGQPTVVTTDNPFVLTVNPPLTTTYVLTGVSSGPCSAGPVSGSVTITPTSAPTANLNGTASVCPGGQVQFPVSFSGGTAPWTFNFTANGIAQPPVTTSTNPYLLTANPAVATTYTLTSVASGSCTGTATGSATVAMSAGLTGNLSGNVVVCPGNPAQLSVTFSGTAAPWTFTYTANGVLQPPVTTSLSPYLLVVNPAVSTTYVLASVASGTCNGTATGSVTVNIAPPLTAMISGGATIQAGQTATLVLNTPGAPPGATIVYNISINGVPQPPITTTTNTNPFDYLVMPPVTSIYTINSATVNGCPANPSGSAVVTVNTSFPATLSGDTTICAGQLAEISVAFGGGATGPFTFVYSIDGVNQPPITTLAIPHIVVVSPSANSVYELVSATAGNGATATVSGTATVSVNAPVLSISPQNLPLCIGTSGSFTVTLTGANPPFDFIYDISGSAQPPVNSPTATFSIPVTASVPTTYGLMAGTAGGCAVSFSNQNSNLQVVGPPQPNNIQVNCNLAAQTYTVSFDVAAQPAPAGAASVDGTPVTGGMFTSAAIPVSTLNYSFNLTNGCGQSTVAGPNTCACVTDAGTMSFLDTLEVCVGGQAVTAHENDQILEPGDVFEYILHTQPGIPVGAILATNPTAPSFSFIAGTMAAGTVYYVSAIAGNNDGSGHADPLDPCLSVASGTPIQFFDPPTMTVEVTDTSVCVGDTVKLLVKLNGNGPFHFTYTNNGGSLPQVNTTKDAASDTYLISAVLQQTTTFQITTFSDATCSGILPPPVTIHVNQVPTLFTQPVEACDFATFTYTVSCTVQGGNQQYLFSGGGGSFTGAFFESAPIPVGTPYHYFLGDTEQCGFVEIQGNPNCSCATNAGQYPFSGPLVFCNGQPAALPPISSSNLEAGDTLIYVLHKTAGPDPQLWTILATNSVPSFNFNAGQMTPDSTYYISAIAGNKGPAGLDLSDPCLSVSPGIAVKWRKPVSAFLSGNLQICQGDTAHLLVTFTGGDAPYTFTYLENGVPKPAQVSPTDTFKLDVSPSLSANYSLLSVSGKTCPGTFNGGGGAAVSVLRQPDIIGLAQSCDFVNMTYTINFKITNGADTAKTFTVGGTPGTLASDTVFTSSPIAFGTPYSFTISTPIGCDTTISGLGQCACTTDAGTMDLTKIEGCVGSDVFPKHNGDQTLDTDDAPLNFILYSNAADPAGSILTFDNAPPISFSFDAATMTAGTTYYIAAVAGNLMGAGQVNPSDPCISVSPPVEVVWHALPTATISGNAKICAGQQATVNINFTGTGPWDFVYKLNGVSTPGTSAQALFKINTTPQQSQTFVMVSVSDKFCPGTVSGSAFIEVQASPKGNLTGPAVVCPGFPANLTLNLSNATTFDISLHGSNGWDTTIIGAVNGQVVVVHPSGPPPVLYSISNLTSPQTPCGAQLAAPIQIDIKKISQSLTLSQFGNYNISCPGASDGSIEVAASGGQPPYKYIWNTGSVAPKITGLAQGWYQVTVTDAVGCVDSVYGLLYEPPAIVFDWKGTPSTCFGGQEGALAVQSVVGGTGPFKITLDGGLAVITDTFPAVYNNLAAGSYDLQIEDANGCTTSGPVSVDAAPELLVELGPDIVLPLGDSVLLEGLVNYPVDTAWFTPVKFLSTPDSLASWSRPLNTMRYQLTVRDANGCTATDFILVEVDPTRHVYVPNAFYPDRGDANSVVAVFGGHDVVEISSFQIFDRWGNLVHEATEFKPNDLARGWDGKSRGQKASPGVYAYWLRVLFANGDSVVYKGDITLIR